MYAHRIQRHFEGALSSPVARKSGNVCLLRWNETVKLLIVGLDAATLDLINPWIAEGKLAVRLAQELASRGIPCVVTKGIAFESTLYGGHGTRHMKDIDFMIAPSDRDVVLSVMRELGFRPFFDWARDPRREEISSRLNPDHLPKLARTIDEPGTRTLLVDVANSLTWTRSPFDVPVEEALKEAVEQPVPGIPGAALPSFRPVYQFLSPCSTYSAKRGCRNSSIPVVM